MQELQIFNFEDLPVRTLTVDEEPFFVGKDVAEILGYSNTRDALYRHVDGEDKDVVKLDTLGGKQSQTVINESGLYSLIFSSKLESAKRFKRWVTSEVLPQLRRTGTYSVNPTIQELANNPELVKMLVEQIARLNDSTSNQSEDLAYLKRAVTGEYVTPQDILAIKYAIKDKAEKFVEGLGVQLSLEDVLAGDIYEMARENKRQEQQKNYHIGKAKSRLLVLTKKHLGMKGNAPNNHIKRKDVDLAIQFIKDVRPAEIEI
ncbi:BRO-N domain-containing protein [Staphylococcus hyicus]|uniref:BRO-N domain-containing protein n=1 Tax=Staphylococcus hyicus TaxID=1284 RepID=UPI00208E1599|nr:Bro-N domain-containing protein [Staphylococcus hyicus]MCO4330263.1 Bro-N domain-containing protein [Staphylococcus hyicus]MCO4332813.1 Bro-N domain-containing protein [Staphylococcus hyicus]MCO4333723.1 Bro-N domain-containing protein [Staphylococcus hyicus]MCO4335817.1 Bro-N domain-containing protein [Staphylococcus hyicus]